MTRRKLSDEERKESIIRRKEYNKQYYETHKEQYKQYCDKNRIHINELKQQRYMKNKEKILENHRRWRQQHRETILNMSDEDFLIAAGFRKAKDEETEQ